jgi:hypothetical protein
MALKSGYSQKTVAENIAIMRAEGYAHNVAVAASLANARNCFFAKYPRGALPLWLAPKSGRRLKNPLPLLAAMMGGKAGSALTVAGHAHAVGGVVKKPRRKNPVPASKLVQERDAANLYTRFTGHKVDPGETVVIDKPELPDVMLVVGDIDGIMYTTVRDGEVEKYVHQFSKNCRPLFCVSSDGKQLFMLGGSYDFTERGIVDRTKKT